MASETTMKQFSPRPIGVCALVPVPPGRAPKVPTRRGSGYLNG